METIKKCQSLYPIFSFALLTIACLLSLIDWCYQIDFFNLMIVLLIVVGIILYVIHVKRLKRNFSILIQTTSDIIENKTIETLIDGESPMAVLSSHLSILDTRMKAMIERLNKEQLLLKDYIEDISHQIKTPLTSMLLREEMLLELMNESKEKGIVLQIYNQTEKIKELIESLLHLAQIESHSITYHKKEYDLEEMIEHISDFLTPLKEKYDVHFCTHDIHHPIYCDEKWMSEAFENILKNCIEQKEHSSIDIYCQNHSTYIDIYIQDHGDGFSEEDIAHVFERFYQGKTKRGNGIGIGLAMSQGIINDHHGHIKIMNDHGALFQITLPHKNTKSKFTVTN